MQKMLQTVVLFLHFICQWNRSWYIERENRYDWSESNEKMECFNH